MSEKVKFTVDGKEYGVLLDELEKYAVKAETRTGYERVEMGAKYYLSEKTLVT